MEGVGARLGRNSNRYGPTTVFTGPVRRWKKKWVHVVAPSKSLIVNGKANVDEFSAQLLFYKWTPQAKEVNDVNGRSISESKSNKGEASEVEESPVKKKFKYIPVVALEEQKNEYLEQIEDETNENETDANTGDPLSKSDGNIEKPGINDIPTGSKEDMENVPAKRQDLNESTLDLSLGLKDLTDGNKSKSEADNRKGYH